MHHRRLRLLSLPAGALARAAEGALRRLAGQDALTVRANVRRRNAARTRRVLGELKGGALKAGQLLSTVETLFPQDPRSTWREALVGLQEDNEPLPFAQVEPVLREDFGPTWRSAFADLDETASAAASIGQVHRATWAGGRPVAVKLQYPKVREALATDLVTLGAVSRLAGLVARRLALPALVAEVRDRVSEELDYLHEAHTQRCFANAYAEDPHVVVPSVVRATPRVLVMDWLDGTPLADVARYGNQQARDQAARSYQRFIVSGPERAGWLHTDPHPGNYRILPDGRLGVLDFGSALEMSGGMPATFGRLISALLGGDHAEIAHRLRAEGFLRAPASMDVARLCDYMAPFVVPARHEEFRFSRDWLRSQFGRVNDPRNPDFAVALQLTLPPKHLFTHRVWLGMVGVLCQLEATVPVRSVLQRWLPGFAPTPEHGPRPRNPGFVTDT